MIQWEGEIVNEIYYNSETKYGVYSVWPTNGEDVFTTPYEKVVGIFSEQPKLKVTYKFTGHETEYQGEKQLNITEGTCKAKTKGSRAIVIAYLKTLPYIGRRAVELYSAYGDEVYEKILNNPKQVAKDIKGLGIASLQKIQEKLKEEVKYAESIGELLKIGLSKRRALKLLDDYSELVVGYIKEDPYFLAEHVKGFTFRDSDVIAYKLGFDLNSPRRYRSALLYYLKQKEGDGDTYVEFNYPATLEFKNLIDAPVYDIYYSESAIIEGIKRLLSEGDICEVKPYCITSKENLEAVNKIVTKIKTLNNNKSSNIKEETIAELIVAYEKKKGITFNNKQKEFLEKLLGEDQGFYLITGIPGSGKTFMIKAAMELTKKKRWVMSAPTGKAAKRLGDVTGVNDASKTIHRLLEYNPFNGFPNITLPGDIFVIDEVSMIDLKLASHLFNALPNEKQVIFLGDNDQLESVGAGRVLGDIIDSQQVYHIHFTEPMRQQENSHLFKVIKEVNNHEVPSPLKKEGECYSYFTTVEEKLYENISNILTDLELDLAYTQVLAPQKKGILGVESLNYQLQKYYLGDIHSSENKILSLYTNEKELYFREGDKVINIKNNYLVPIQRGGKDGIYVEGDEHSNIYNGDIGEIHYINEETKSIYVYFEDKGVIDYKYNKNDLKHAYALTVHKYQGSEANDIIFIVPNKVHQSLAVNNIIYTAFSRAQKRLIVAGNEQTYKRMITNTYYRRRKTMLEDFLRGDLNYYQINKKEY